jgi:2-phosphoglycerate kinase
LLSLPCEAVVHRALRERVSLILEGVHVHPSLAGKIDNDGGGAAIVSVMLAVVKQERLKRHLSGRGESAPGRGSQKYLSDFDSIWALQSALLYEADVLGVPIVNNDNKDEATDQIMRIVIAALAEDSDASVKSVFG